MAYVAQAAKAAGDFLASTDYNQAVDNDIALEAAIADSYVLTADHDHDGVNSAAAGAASIDNTMLNTAISTVTDVNTESSFGTSEYYFYPRIKCDTGTALDDVTMVYGAYAGTTYTARIYMHRASGSDAADARCYYVTASPPHKLGGLLWPNCFVTLRRRKSDGVFLGGQEADEPVWGGNGIPLPKDHPARLLIIPHPFTGYLAEGIPDDVELVMPDIRHLAEVVDLSSPAQLEYKRLMEQRKEWIAKGLDEKELIEWESKAQAKAKIEQLQIDRARTELDGWDSFLEHVYAEVEKLDYDVKASRLKVLPVLLEKKRRRVQKIARRMPKIEAIKESLAVREMSVLSLAKSFTKREDLEPLEQELFDALQVTHELKKDDRKSLPKVEVDGKPWASTVKVLRRPSEAI